MDLSLELCDFSKFIFEKMTAQCETLGHPLRNIERLVSAAMPTFMYALCESEQRQIHRLLGKLPSSALSVFSPRHDLGRTVSCWCKMLFLFELKVCVVSTLLQGSDTERRCKFEPQCSKTCFGKVNCLKARKEEGKDASIYKAGQQGSFSMYWIDWQEHKGKRQ